MRKNIVLFTQLLHYPDKFPRPRVRYLDERHDVREASHGAVLDVGRGLALIVRRLDPVLIGHHFLVRTSIEQQPVWKSTNELGYRVTATTWLMAETSSSMRPELPHAHA